MQRVVGRCVDAEVNIEPYNRNRELLYNSLCEYGYECIKPQGAFYLFVKTPTEDENVFVEAAKKHHILVVPGSSFMCSGYVRIAYCVDYDTIKNSLEGFKKLAEEFK
jgi:aspartate aminotransferase